MADKSAIEWTNATWNPVRGCTRVSEGCRNCYAERIAARFSGPGMPYEGLAESTAQGPRWNGAVRLVPEHLADPLKWKRPRRIFVNSMSDLFHEGLSFEEIAAVYAVMAAAAQHTFQILTKRPERALAFNRHRFGLETCADSVAREAESSAEIVWDSRGSNVDLYRAESGSRREVANRRPWPGWPLPNIHLGVSVEDQTAADRRIPVLLECPAAVRFVSYEPALDAVDFTRLPLRREEGAMAQRQTLERESFRPPTINALKGYSDNGDERRIDWVIVGGESGPGARPFDLAWARQIVEQCGAAGVPVFVKQLGSRPVDSSLAGAGAIPRELSLRDRKGGDPAEWPAELQVRQMPEARP